MRLLLAALLWASARPAAARAPTAREMYQYRVLQANVDNAFLWAFLNKNHDKVGPASGKIRYIGSQLVRGTGQTFFFNCHFYRLKSDLANAATSPKGNIFLYSGLDRLKLTEAEQAAILAHEIAHLALSHWLARIQRNVEAAQLANYAAKAYGRNSAKMSLLYSMVQGLKYSQQEEYDADALGAQFLLNAHYPPQAMASALQKLDADQQAQAAAAGRPAGNAFLSDHPLTPDRIARLNALIPTLKVQQKHLHAFR